MSLTLAQPDERFDIKNPLFNRVLWNGRHHDVEQGRWFLLLSSRLDDMQGRVHARGRVS